ncbi:MAG: phosphate signaling complex protein PhoU [Alphaproteobacteria bacterium]|nr:phosphate signaling complex protein PhoU [Alphaproteobacteria bacterium]
MERHFEQELDKLNKRLIKMGNLVALQVHNALEALLNCDLDLARTVIENDNKVDRLDVKIDKLCQRIFALTQPVATDLRLIMAALKMNNDLERMGDQAVNIASKVEGISEYREITGTLHMDELAGMADMIVQDVNTLIGNRNPVFVRDIFQMANLIEDKAQAISTRIFDEMMHKSEVIMVATHLLIVLTQIERIAGYSTNIAESVYFIAEGKMIKHKKTFRSGVDTLPGADMDSTVHPSDENTAEQS